MSQLLVLIVAVGGLLAISWFRRQSSAARRQAGATLLLAGVVLVVLFALASGRLHPLLAIVFAALALLPRLIAAKRVFDRTGASSGPSQGARSKVSTRFFDMFLEHDSGAMDGTVHEGRFAGRQLSSLEMSELMELLARCRAEDEQSATVLEAYLDRAHGEGWREHAGPDPGADRAEPARGALGLDEARDILGVSATASEDEIVAAHRRLMQKLHPDQGGSNYLAAKVNQARDLLLKRH